MRVLSHNVIDPEGRTPDRYIVFAHGILGTRANWRTIARRAIADTHTGAVLVDLREHGESRGFAPPHTVDACANDLTALRQHLGLPIVGALGHSFGAKVALRWAAHVGDLTSLYIVDADPGPRQTLDASRVEEVVQTLRNLGRDFEDRAAFVDAVVAAGHPKNTAVWLAMNLKRADGGRRTFDLDLEAIGQLLKDYAVIDCWPVVTDHPDTRFLFVVGANSSVVSSDVRQTMTTLAAERPNVAVEVVPDAGHWVHAEAPDVLVALLKAEFAKLEMISSS